MRCSYGPCTCTITEPSLFCSQACSLAPEYGPFCGCEHAVCESTMIDPESTKELLRDIPRLKA